MKNLLKIVVAFGILTLASCKKEEQSYTKENGDQKELQLAVDNVNKMAPQEIGEGVRLDKAALEDHNRIHYYYTFIDDDVDSLTTEQIEEFKQMLKEESTHAVKVSEDMEGIKTNDVTLKYSYKDKNGKQLLDFEILPEEYK